jgi:electron transport complex protein RnfC
MDRRCGGMEFRRGAVRTVPEPPRVGASVAGAAPDEADTEGWLRAFREDAGWSQPGMTGLAEQVRGGLGRRPELLVLVGMDRYPPFAIRTAILRTWPREAVAGLELLRGLLGGPRAMIMTPRGVPGISVVRRLAKEHGIRRLGIEPVYPVADPTMVAWHAATAGRRKLRPGRNPAEVGLVMVEPWVCVRIGRWLRHQALDSARPVWLAHHPDDCSGTIRWLTPGQIPQELLARDQAVVLGDPLSGRPFDAERGLPAGVEALFLAPRGGSASTPEPCISCGWCAEVCPTHLRPIELVRRIEAGRPAQASLDWCLDCGLCTRVCPSGIDLATPLASRHERTAASDG